ncbi:MAG: phosphate regulon transcriptional regulatory protein PhoB [Magnetovibrio sp.]|nr:phosphate regulon transcriptional regulatory protein PhoB [Magnetovibrio sp.]
MKPAILLVEDDPSLIELVRYNLEAADFDVAVEMDGDGGLMAIRERDFDLVILDWMMPNMSGIEVVRQIRRMNDKRATPVIMLTARGEETDKIRGLDAGADDYVVKPFSPAELVSRVRALLRRSAPDMGGETLAYEDLEMDLVSHKVNRGGRSVHLGPTEYRLLRVLMENPGRVYSREQLLDKAWGQNIYVEIRTVDVHVRRLRRAINIDGKPDLIRTVRGSGYALDFSPG